VHRLERVEGSGCGGVGAGEGELAPAGGMRQEEEGEGEQNGVNQPEDNNRDGGALGELQLAAGPASAVNDLVVLACCLQALGPPRDALCSVHPL
jgi:hypothetical protein